MQTTSIPVSEIKQGSHLTTELRSKGELALEQWRKERSAAIKKGGKALEKWNLKEAEKKANKTISATQAIKNFCIDCVGGSYHEVSNCTSKNCKLYNNRPYQS